MSRIWLGLTLALLIQGCRNRTTELHQVAANPTDTSFVRFARGFSIREQGNTWHIVVKNPWQHASSIQFHYLLCDSPCVPGPVDAITWQIRTPVKRVICLSTTHIGFIDFIDELGSIVGISGKSLVVNEELQNGLQQAKIADVGYDENLDYETIVRLKPDVVFAYGVSMAVTNTVKKLNELGIAVVLIGEYLEEEPLAKMEWAKLFAAFYNRLPETTRRFETVAARYQQLTALASSVPEKPGVMLGLPWSGTWYVSGSQSYIARMIGDAGGKYIMDHLQFNESRPVALEEIYARATMADFWINPGSALSKNDILSVDERFGQLPPFLQNSIYNNNNLLNRTGGNAFFESGVVEPDIILSDLIYILHPQLLPSHSLKYYRNLR